MFHTYQQWGIRWAGGSDHPVTPFPARYGLGSSVARTTLHGTHGATPFGNEAVDVKTAIRSYTAWAPRQLFLEDRVGSIEVGKEADTAVWDRDHDSVPADGLKEMRCDLTLFKGRIGYRRDQ